ncbi:MAG: SCO1664 family protein [Chloroflexi bacterium]|nr:SCO1664 family protein [Chloroflexota bacterium]MCL5275512.1 SCO1664 family protein [Chloroflexota bacterium]
MSEIALTREDTLELLATGEVESLGLLPWSSNYTFLVKIMGEIPRPHGKTDIAEVMAVYKPRRGEAPLWDFPEGTLCQRELAAYMVSVALGWDLIPPTVLRDGPHGVGSVQLYIDNDADQHFFTFRDDKAYCDQLKRLSAFDLITNNADRKSGHCLLDKCGHVWAIDHGITFNTDYKLRTVIWDFAGQPIAPEMLADMRRLLDSIGPKQPLGKALRALLEEDEVATFKRRIHGLMDMGAFPGPNRTQRSIPWPPV